MSLAQLAQIRLNAADPTRTVSLRREWMADVTRRHRELGRAIAETVGNMGLGPVTLVAGGTERFLFKRDPEKVDEFMSWLREEEARTTLELIPGRTGQLEPWTNTYVRSSYVKGLEKANRQLRAKGIDLPSTTIRGPQGILGIFHQPFHAERASLIYQRTFEGLKGIDATMNARLRQVLTQGILEGVGPEEIARRMVGKGSPLETVGITRGKLIARTEIVETYNQAAVGEYSRAEGIIGEPILVEWITAEDERVRGSHANRHGKVYTQEEFLQLIGEPNCRCAGTPYIESIDGDIPIAAEISPSEVGKKASVKKRKPSGPQWESVDDLVEMEKVFKEKLNINSFDVSTLKKSDALARLNAIGDEMTGMINKHPSIKTIMDDLPLEKLVLAAEDNLGSVGYKTAGGLYNSDTKIIHLATRTKSISVNPLEKGGWNVSGNSMTSTFRHELGHHFDRPATRIATDKGLDFIDVIADFEQDKVWWKKNLSVYAEANAKESFAECFSFYTHSEYASGAGKKLTKGLDAYMKEVLK